MKTPIQDLLHAQVESLYPAIYLVTQEETDANELIQELAESDGQQRPIVEWNLASGFTDFHTRQPQTEWCDLAAALNVLLADELDNQFIVLRDAHLALRDTSGTADALAVARLRALIARILEDENATTTIFLVSSQAFVPPELETFITIFELPLPDEAEIRDLIGRYLQAYELTLPPEHITRLALALQGLTQYEIGQLLNRGYQNDGLIDLDDIPLVQEEKRQIIRKSGILEMVTVTETLDNIGGLEKIKPWLRQKSGILENWAQARAFGVESPKGVLIVGMPGCGKSLTAKATAAQFALPLLKMDMGSLMGKYVGESENNMRRALQVAEAVSPCVLWVDEVEKAFVGAGSGGSGGGSEVTTRLFGYFLTWMQEKTKQVFVVATANDISALPPELLRKGRFDEIFYVDFPNAVEREAIFRVHLEKRKKLHSGIDLGAMAQATEGYSGADIESVVKEAIELAFLDGRKPLDTALLRRVTLDIQPLSVVMKDRITEYQKRFEKMKIKSAS